MDKQPNGNSPKTGESSKEKILRTENNELNFLATLILSEKKSYLDRQRKLVGEGHETFNDHYSTLNLGSGNVSELTAQEIVNAAEYYRQRVASLENEKLPNSSQEILLKLHALINQAEQVLSDPTQRRGFDQARAKRLANPIKKKL